MTITVKRLIMELEKIENKMLEVEVSLVDIEHRTPSIGSIITLHKKVMIHLEYSKDRN